MKADPAGVREVLSMRVDLEALYINGPFDAQGQPASPDVHVLAISRGDSVRDIHLVPGTSRFERRVEVSAVPLALVQETANKGVSTWFTFFTADKLRSGKPVLESPEAEGLRRRIKENLRIRPAFFAEVLRGVVQTASHLVGPSDRASAGTADTIGPRKQVGTTGAAALNGRLVALLAAHAAIRSGHTFSKLSDMLTRGVPFPVALPEAAKAEAARTLAATARTLEKLFGLCGIDTRRLTPAAVPTDQGPQGATP